MTLLGFAREMEKEKCLVEEWAKFTRQESQLLQF